MNLYVSNLAYSVTDDELRSEFAAFGAVSSARVVMDRETGRSRGFGFVEIPNDAEAKAAMAGLEGTNLAGRPLKVVEARPKEDRPARPAGDSNFKKKPGGYQGGSRPSSTPSYNDWDDNSRGGKKAKPWERGRHNPESEWD